MRTTTSRAGSAVVFVVGLALLFLTACGGDEGLDSMGVDHVLAFDGENCTYEGPTELTPGPTELIFLNESEGQATMNLVLHLNNALLR